MTKEEPITEGSREFYEKYFSAAALMNGFPASTREPFLTPMMTGVAILRQLERIADTLEEMLIAQKATR